jgi:peptidylamidoglycolate lyase
MLAVTKFSSSPHDGRLLLTIGERRVPGWDATHFNEPTDVAVSADGSFFVSDGYRNARVAHYSATGTLLKEWGAKGTLPNQFQTPHGVALDGRGRVYVADRENSRLQVFDTAGTLLRVWPSSPTVGRVFAVAVSSLGYIYLARKDGPEAVSILDGEWHDIGMIPADPSVLVTPHAVAIQGDSVIYIADTTGERIRKFIRR